MTEVQTEWEKRLARMERADRCIRRTQLVVAGGTIAAMVFVLVYVYIRRWF